MRYFFILITVLLTFACTRDEARGFRLPDGDVKAGKAKFVELGCSSCHSVRSVSDLPKPTANPPVPIALGGGIPSVPTDGQLVTAIINPSHRITARKHAGVKSGDTSRMGDYSDAMTVRDLADVVAFLHTCYTQVVPRTGP